MSDELEQKLREIFAWVFDFSGWRQIADAILRNKPVVYKERRPLQMSQREVVKLINSAIDRIAKLPQPESQAMGWAELQPRIESTGHKPTERERALTALQHSLHQIEQNAKTAEISLAELWAELRECDDTEG